MFSLDDQWLELSIEEHQCKRLDILKPIMEEYFDWYHTKLDSEIISHGP